MEANTDFFYLVGLEYYLLKYNGCQLATAVKIGTYPHTTAIAIIYYQVGLFTNPKDKKTEKFCLVEFKFSSNQWDKKCQKLYQIIKKWKLN